MSGVSHWEGLPGTSRVYSEKEDPSKQEWIWSFTIYKHDSQAYFVYYLIKLCRCLKSIFCLQITSQTFPKKTEAFFTEISWKIDIPLLIYQTHLYIKDQEICCKKSCVIKLKQSFFQMHFTNVSFTFFSNNIYKIPIISCQMR